MKREASAAGGENTHSIIKSAPHVKAVCSLPDEPPHRRTRIMGKSVSRNSDAFLHARCVCALGGNLHYFHITCHLHNLFLNLTKYFMIFSET